MFFHVNWKILHRAYSSYSWVPVVGPMIGACLGGLVYKLFVGHHFKNEGKKDEDDDEGSIGLNTKLWRL